MKTVKIIFGTVLALIVAQISFGQGTITGSSHDFSGLAWNLPAPLGGQICKPCHIPHTQGGLFTGVPLWNHEKSTQVFTPYTNSTMDAVTGAPDGTSLMCLGCHDGLTALNSFGLAPAGAPVFMAAIPANLGTDLTNDHPVSFVFNAALATADGALFNPTVVEWNGAGSGTIDAKLLDAADKVQCASCHNPHGVVGVTKFLRKSNAGSALCLTCHNK